jgi:ATP-dependent helicase/nuclease subunit A
VSERLAPSALTVERQRRASDARVSAWVSANAGSGKTTVLSHRVIRLLLDGADPAKVLCITFTKAAAANMANKVFGILSDWATMPDADLDAAIAALGEPVPDAARRARARRLFARALDTPGGLKVLTIHGFCERVLKQFPFEANVPAAFSVLDERLEAELVAAARDRVLATAVEHPDGPEGQALSAIVGEVSDFAFGLGLQAALGQRRLLGRLMGAGAARHTDARLAAALGLAGGETAAGIEARILGEGLARDDWPELIAWLAAGGVNDGKRAACLREAAGAGDADTARACYLGLFFKDDGEPRLGSQLATKRTRDRNPAFAAMLDGEQERLVALLERRRAAACRERTIALLTLAEAVRTHYEAEKAARGALDFADLILKTRALLQRDAAAWVLYKLDGGIDHVLVDEAQDTSPEQWDIVAALTAEFTAGAGARPVLRTVFAVGDEKQSIFGFQGAAPEAFGTMRNSYRDAHAAAGAAFEALQLTQSFRSAGSVLGAVDRVFERPEAYSGLTFDAVRTQHETARPHHPGRVEVWPPVAPPRVALPEKVWNAPFDEMPATSGVVVLAERIADAVSGWIAGRDALGPCRPVPPGEILVLIRTRGPLFEALLRALKREGVPIAGADRLEIGAHIAVMDCLALADALAQPQDDLALAAVLKSPLFGLDDDDLIRIAPERDGSLRDALRAAAPGMPAYAAAERKLVQWADEASRLPPFDFFARVLGRDGGRRAFRARLGGEVDDPLDEFLRIALAFAAAETPTLTGFAAWMRAASTEVKRDLEVGGGAVRVMTVHGAKGLEAELVVLADIGEPPTGRDDPPLFLLPDPVPGVPDLLAWSPRKDLDPAPVRAARQAGQAREAAERRRLLYVALTRAKDRLVVTAHTTAQADGTPRIPPASWYALVRDGLGPHAREVPVPALGGTVLVHDDSLDWPDRPTPPPPLVDTFGLPMWLHWPAPPEPPAPAFVAPSLALPHIVAPRGPASAAERRTRTDSLERGRLIHALIELLPTLPAARRAEIGGRRLRALAPGWDDGRRAALLAEVLALVEHTALAALFAPGALTEVPVAGEIPAAADRAAFLVSGRIDRLIVTDDEVRLVDFKTDRAVPDAVPLAYAAQLALYRALVAPLFPGRRVRAFVLWTSAPRLDEVPAADLDAAFARLGAETLTPAGSLPN